MSERGNFRKPPKKLLSAIRKAGSQRAFSKNAGINDSYVNNLVKRGIEPTDQTENGREIRVKLFLPRRKPKPRIVKEHPAQLTVEWWDALRKKATRSMVRHTNKMILKDWRP